ncbi:1-aminocyclopropane-1-carboxylate deaminase/D-cysteine desulfhydrase [Pontimicrobium aquaticum]|uniref:1-aminocyclopropane-1-carboxylate deaminase/D-cysteine desulfhydrase n=1 Tax=Pontimicrobium aquaticum TaxID=2565367 RepID=A0A4U0EK32_9FLAO|nr:pyridoxal-phosphate dependent enzyme [Pontimicrobium aquaticum]TJY31836.1 1-aminocyclopropane-1-carboxylate deaminase/D-cysteine desulfhydrase [Pontimicrobium aquaticum]
MSFNLEDSNSINQRIELPKACNVKLYIKREDNIHPFISGNKYRKLKYNIQEAQNLKHDTLLTFGGAYSNHIAAVAAAGNEFGLKTIGVIRGEELADKVSGNPTLQFSKSQGMQFKFVSRTDYRSKEETNFIKALESEFGNFYLVPEGGTNDLAVRGCEEILNIEDDQFDYICCAVGTGGTISGLINASKPHQKILGFPALKGDFLSSNISKFVTKNNWELLTKYHFGGYAKVNKELIDFINQFKLSYNIPLDPIYTGKLMYGVIKMIEASYFEKNAKILVIHTGGLQGVSGMNKRLIDKDLPLINE